MNTILQSKTIKKTVLMLSLLWLTQWCIEKTLKETSKSATIEDVNDTITLPSNIIDNKKIETIIYTWSDLENNNSIWEIIIQESSMDFFITEMADLWIQHTDTIRLITNTDWIFRLQYNIKELNIQTVQSYCDRNNINILVNEENKTNIMESLIAMVIKDKLIEQWDGDRWEKVFNYFNDSDNTNHLGACENLEYINPQDPSTPPTPSAD